MNITLRRAKAIQTSIVSATERLNVVTQIELNQFQDILSQLENAYTLAINTDARISNLTAALFSIRKLVGEANATSNIDTLMNQSAFLTRRIAQLSELASAPEMIDLDILIGKVSQLASESSSWRGSSNAPRTSVFTATQIAEYTTELANLRRQKQQIDDEILSINISTKIELSAETIATLNAEAIL